MRLNFRKIAAIGMSAMTLGLTAGIAAAAAAPSPFVKSGQGDFAVVYGSAAPGGLDQAQANSIAEWLQGMVTTVGLGSDTYKFEKTSTKFHLGDNFTTIRGTLNDDYLPTLLTDGKYIDNDNDEFDYTQKIEMNATPLVMFDDNDYAEDAPTVGFRVQSGYNVLNYTITFSDQPLIDDLVNSDIPLMGKNYYVLSNGTSGANLVLTLLDSAETTLLNKGDTTTLTAGGTTYTVSIPFVSSTEVILDVNGERTNSLAEGDTYKLSDGSYVGIRDILYDAKEAGVSKVEFSIGSGKVKLTSGSEIQVNDETVNGIKAVMVNASGTITSSTGTLTSIEIDWSTDEDTFITADTELEMPTFKSVKLAYGGLNYPVEEMFSVEQGSSTYIKLDDFPLTDGKADIPLLFGAASGTDGNWTGLGKDATNRLVTNNATDSSLPLTFDKDTDDQFVVTYESSTECESYLMKATGFGTDSSSNNVTTLQRYKNGAWTDERTVKAGDTFSIGQAEVGIQYVERSPGNFVNITANSSNTNFNILCSAEGLKVWLPVEQLNTTLGTVYGGHNSTKGAIYFNATGNPNWTSGHDNNLFDLSMQEEDKDGNIASGDLFNISLGWDSSSTAEPQVADLEGEDVTAAEIGDTDVFRSFQYSALATEFLWNQPTAQDSIKIIYHGSEVTADVYITSTDVSGGSTDLGGVLVTDSEVSSVSGNNLVVVGGSCINTVAADLLGVAEGTCGDAWTSATDVGSGQYLIQSFARTGDKVALLVAGYEAADTAAAASRLVNQPGTIDTAVGNKYVGVVGSEGSSTITKVA